MKQARRNLWRVGLLMTLSCAVMAPRARASFLTGNDLLEACQSTKGSFSSGGCMGFTTGVADAMAWNELNGSTACLPLEATSVQVRDIAVQFLVKHPELRHHTACYLVTQALSKAFPCK